MPSCMTASRHGVRRLPPRAVSFVLEITVIPYVADNNKEWKKCKRRSKQASAAGRKRGRGFSNHLDGMGAALTQAKYLAELFGNSSPAGWSVVWTGDLCRIFYPPDRDQVNVIVITDWARQVNFEVTSREGGIQLCAPLWQEFFHVGDVPTRKEVLSLYDASRRSYTKEDLGFNATDDDDPEYEGDVPCTRNTTTAPAIMDMVLVRNWLMDTGCPMDLIDEGEAAPFAQFIERGGDVRLATANGEIRANRRLELHIEELDEDVTPMVLPNTPSVLSIGRRVIEKGYDFVWRHGEEPYLLHPEDRRRIDLVVQDFCPFLEIKGGAMPDDYDRKETECPQGIGGGNAGEEGLHLEYTRKGILPRRARQASRCRPKAKAWKRGPLG